MKCVYRNGTVISLADVPLPPPNEGLHKSGGLQVTAWHYDAAGQVESSVIFVPSVAAAATAKPWQLTLA